MSTVEKSATKKAVKKTTKGPAEKKAKTAAAKTASHPPYFQMIKEAIMALGEKGGSSPHAISKYMEEKHKSVLPENFRKMLALQLKNSAAKGKLTKVKASYKLSVDAVKKDKVVEKKKVKKPAARASADVAAVKKKAKKAKKVKKTPVKAKKAKQAKSIKSPAAKKARKAAV